MIETAVIEPSVTPEELCVIEKFSMSTANRLLKAGAYEYYYAGRQRRITHSAIQRAREARLRRQEED